MNQQNWKKNYRLKSEKKANKRNQKQLRLVDYLFLYLSFFRSLACGVITAIYIKIPRLNCIWESSPDFDFQRGIAQPIVIWKKSFHVFMVHCLSQFVCRKSRDVNGSTKLILFSVYSNNLFVLRERKRSLIVGCLVVAGPKSDLPCVLTFSHIILIASTFLHIQQMAHRLLVELELYDQFDSIIMCVRECFLSYFLPALQWNDFRLVQKILQIKRIKYTASELKINRNRMEKTKQNETSPVELSRRH